MNNEPITEEIPAVIPAPPSRADVRRWGVLISELASGTAFLLAIVCILHAVWIYGANGLDQMHVQETIVSDAANTIEDVDTTSDRIAAPHRETAPVETAPAYGDVIGWMYIPDIEQDWKRAIQQGTDLDVLDNGGLGHYENTVMPGQNGNSAYAGHRTGGDLGFVDRLTTGDPIVIQTAGHWYVYRVNAAWVTTPDDSGVLDSEDGKPWLTLTTCHPMLATEDESLKHRYIVRATLDYWADVADGIPQEIAVSKDKPVAYAASRVSKAIRDVSKSMPVTPVLAACCLFAWLVLNGFGWVLAHGRKTRRAASWNPLTLMWRIQQGPAVVRVTAYALWWMMLVFAAWAWGSPWVSVNMPWVTSLLSDIYPQG